MVRMTSSDGFPQRLSDAERDAAVSALRAHLEAGRLAPEEFDERTTAARVARTASDVVPLFGDLPAQHPAYVDAARPTWNTYPGTSPASPAAGSPEPGAPSYPSPAPSYGPSGPVYSGTVVPRTQGPVPSQPDRWVGVLQAVIWPVAILMFVTGNGWWWILVAVVVTSAIRGYQGRQRRQPPPY